MTDEEKAIKKEETAGNEERNLRLLQGYDSKSDMKRYNPKLYEKTFGTESKDYKETEKESEIDKEFNKKKQEIEDKRQGYIVNKRVSRKSRKSRNSDGTKKSSYKYSKHY
jgi:hypothetical protein